MFIFVILMLKKCSLKHIIVMLVTHDEFEVCMNTTIIESNSSSLGHKANSRWETVKSYASDVLFILKLNVLVAAFIFWQASAYIPNWYLGLILTSRWKSWDVKYRVGPRKLESCLILRGFLFFYLELSSVQANINVVFALSVASHRSGWWSIFKHDK